MTNQSKGDNKKIKWISLIAILAFTAILYSGSLTNEILNGWDDGEYLSNPDIQHFDVAKFFDNYYLGMYQPLAVLTISLNWQSGEQDPVPYHATNLLIHLINIILVFYLFYKMSSRIDVATFVSLLFAIHPLQVEAVAWIAARSTGLYAMFYLAALIAYFVYLKEQKVGYIILTFIFFVLSCLSKSMAITLPVMLLVFDYLKERRFRGWAIWEKIPFFIVSVIIGIVTINAASAYGHIRNLAVSYNFFDRIVLIVYSLVFYLVKTLAPNHLSAVYAYPAKHGLFLPWQYYFSLFIFAVLILNVIIIRKSRRRTIFGLMFFTVALGPVLPLFWSRMLMLADRYTYIPIIGIFFILARIYVRYVETRAPRIAKYRIFINTGLFIYIVFLTVSTYHRIGVWENAKSLVSDVIRNDRSDVDVAIGYFFRGNLRDRSDNLNGALNDFSKAIELNPDYTLAYNNRGIIKGSMKDYKGALADFSKAIDLEPGYADAYYNRGNVHYYLKQFNEACSDWSRAEYLGSKQATKVRQKYCR